MQNTDPTCVEDWLKLIEGCRIVVSDSRENSTASTMVWSNAGFAVECILKAAIHAKERFNRWPDDRRDLRTHDLNKLAKILGLVIEPSHQIAPAWAVVTQWRRRDMYNPAEISPKVLNSLLDAVFSEKGVVEWIRQNYLRNY